MLCSDAQTLQIYLFTGTCTGTTCTYTFMITLLHVMCTPGYFYRRNLHANPPRSGTFCCDLPTELRLCPPKRLPLCWTSPSSNFLRACTCWLSLARFWFPSLCFPPFRGTYARLTSARLSCLFPVVLELHTLAVPY